MVGEVLESAEKRTNHVLKWALRLGLRRHEIYPKCAWEIAAL